VTYGQEEARRSADLRGGAMDVVIVDGDVSYPASSGKRLRTLHLMQRLARRCRVTYIARSRGGPGEAERAAAFLNARGVATVFADEPLPRQAGVGFYARLTANLLSPVPYSAAAFDSPRLRRAVQEHEARRKVDLWQFEWTPYLGMLRAPRRTRRVLMAHNVDSLIWQRYHETERRPLRRWFVADQRRKFERYERRVFAEADRVVAVSDSDAAVVRERFAAPRVEVVDNGVDCAFYAVARGDRQPNRVLFLGSLDWRPNQDAVRLLLDATFPAVVAQEPSARLALVGRSPPEWMARRVAALPWAELHADVPDVRPRLAGAGVMAVPLRIGGGSRLKVLEALASGLPVVSTRVGAEGLHLEGGRDLLLAEPDEMAAALVRCVRAPEEARRTAENGRRVVRERYDWDALAEKLAQVWESVVRGPQRWRDGLPLQATEHGLMA
jgi:glycosyltransferase involved in cell wall biosynthesis